MKEEEKHFMIELYKILVLAVSGMVMCRFFVRCAASSLVNPV